jgi:hypothetical protein
MKLNEVALKFLDRMLTSIVTSCVIFFFSFSFITGKFPPRKSDMAKAFEMMKTMATTTQDINAFNKGMEGQPPNLEQMVQIQRLALQRSEASLTLSKLMVRFPQGIPNAPIATKINEVYQHLSKSDEAMALIQQEIMKVTAQQQPQGGQ